MLYLLSRCSKVKAKLRITASDTPEVTDCLLMILLFKSAISFEGSAKVVAAKAEAKRNEVRILIIESTCSV